MRDHERAWHLETTEHHEIQPSTHSVENTQEIAKSHELNQEKRELEKLNDKIEISESKVYRCGLV